MCTLRFSYVLLDIWYFGFESVVFHDVAKFIHYQYIVFCRTNRTPELNTAGII
jgi:hypothetical protein